MSAGELESEWAGTPAHLIRDRYRTASQVIKTRGKMSCLVINDIDAGAGRFENTQMTVNTQMVMGTLMNLADNPTRVSVGQEYREADVVPRVPIILTGNDLSTLWAPLIRDGRMDKFYWAPSREDMINIVTCMYKKDGLAMSDIETLVDTFPSQALDFYGAMRSRTYDDQVKKWLDGIGGPEKLKTVFPVRPGGEEPELDHYQQTLENLVVAGKELVHEQDMVMELKLADEYMNSEPISGGGLSLSMS